MRPLLPLEKTNFLKKTASEAFEYYAKQLGCTDIDIWISNHEVYDQDKKFPAYIECSGHSKDMFYLRLQIFLAPDELRFRWAPAALHGKNQKIRLIWSTDKRLAREQIYSFVLYGIQECVMH